MAMLFASHSERERGGYLPKILVQLGLPGSDLMWINMLLLHLCLLIILQSREGYQILTRLPGCTGVGWGYTVIGSRLSLAHFKYH